QRSGGGREARQLGRVEAAGACALGLDDTDEQLSGVGEVVVDDHVVELRDRPDLVASARQALLDLGLVIGAAPPQPPLELCQRRARAWAWWRRAWRCPCVRWATAPVAAAAPPRPPARPARGAATPARPVPPADTAAAAAVLARGSDGPVTEIDLGDASWPATT